jgi:hypothetical protein
MTLINQLNATSFQIESLNNELKRSKDINTTTQIKKEINTQKNCRRTLYGQAIGTFKIVIPELQALTLDQLINSIYSYV